VLRGVALAIGALAAAAFARPLGAQDFAAAAIETEPLAEDLHVLYGGQAAGNTLALFADGRALIVDTGVPETAPQLEAAVVKLGGPVTTAINTHWHFDHADGNKLFGPNGVRLIAHENSRAMLKKHNSINVVRTIIEQPAYPPAALPAITFPSELRYHFGGEEIELFHVAPAHTAGDTVVLFRRHNVVHTGDVFLTNAYPFVDFDAGGDLDGLIEFCRAVLARIDEQTTIVPGHGPLARRADLVAYVEMLTAVRIRVAALIADGASLEQVLAAQPTAEWDERFGDPATYFIDRAYASLRRARTNR
jgi:cyclase